MLMGSSTFLYNNQFNELSDKVRLKLNNWGNHTGNENFDCSKPAALRRPLFSICAF
jgi:hypothetical protein